MRGAEEKEQSLERHLSPDQLAALIAFRRERRAQEEEAEDAQAALEDTLEIIRLPKEEKPVVDGPSLRVAAGRHMNTVG